MRQERHSTYFDLIDAFREGCPLCFLIKESVNHYLDNLLYEHVNDPQTRKKIRKSTGFCNKHAWQMQRSGEALGLAILYEDISKCFAFELEGNKSSKNAAALCPACDQERTTEKRYLSILIRNMRDNEFVSIYEASFGLCRPHLSMAIEGCKDVKMINKIKDIELNNIAALIGELKELQRKYDYRFSKEKIGKEGTAWIRAIEKMTGKEGVF